MIVCDVCGNSMESHPPCYNDPLCADPDPEQYCEGCLAGIDQEHRPDCSVWLQILRSGH